MGERTANVVVIGAGFTVLPAQKVAITCARLNRRREATTVGEGTRAGTLGFCPRLPCEDAEASRMAQLEAANQLTRAAMASIKEDVDQFGEQGILAHSGTYAPQPVQLVLPRSNVTKRF